MDWNWYFVFCRRRDLLLTINWKHVVFTQADPCYHDGRVKRLPHSRTLFRTSFANRTDTEQSYLCKTNQCTEAILKFEYTPRLSKSQGSTALIFRLPENVVQLAGGIQREQSVDFGKDTYVECSPISLIHRRSSRSIKKYPMHWNVNSPVRVAPHTHLYAELSIDEEAYFADFSMLVEFSGHVTGSITTRQLHPRPLSFIDVDIGQIFREAMKDNRRLNAFEVTDGHCPVVRYTLRGQCQFTYGVEQHLMLQQESMEASWSEHDECLWLACEVMERCIFFFW